MDIEKYFRLHQARYEMKPVDEIKLLFQAHFGGGHFVFDEKSALEFLEKELFAISESEFSNYPLVEKTSDEFSRLHLSQLKNHGLSPETAAKLFVLSAKEVSDTAAFSEDIKRLVEPTSAKEYLEKGVRPISHSEFYRKKYCPHYRVISNAFVKYIPLLTEIDEIRQKKQRLVVGIDGKAGSGKSYLAAFLQSVYGAKIIKADDFFLPQSKKTKERLGEVGGNIDYERMKAEVFDNLEKGELSYSPFDCKTQKTLSPISVDLSGVTVVEGSYSTHPYFEYTYDISVFSDIDEALQKRRIILRNGDFSKRFFEEFIPKENEFFDKFKTKESADIVIEADN